MAYGQWTNDSVSETVIILSVPGTIYHLYQLLCPSCEHGTVVSLAVLL